MPSRGVLLDVKHISEEITLENIDLDKIQAGNFVIFHTGMLMCQHFLGHIIVLNNVTEYEAYCSTF